MNNPAKSLLLSYPTTDAALRWLEVILAERFGLAWQLVRTAEGLRLQLAGAEGAILFDSLCEGFTQAHSDQPFGTCQPQMDSLFQVNSQFPRAA